LENASTFSETVYGFQGSPLMCRGVETIQVNLGYLCNKRCSHCHVGAGPDRTEVMGWETMQAIIRHANELGPRLVDITGGAPEMNPHLASFIGELTRNGHSVQVRTNLTVLLEEGMEGFIRVYRENGVRLVASLPCYEDAEVDSVRGDGTFHDSVEVLRRLNQAGYGVDDELQLDLVFNPEDAFLPPNQTDLEKVFKARLMEDFGIVFNRLLTITNMPVGRFETRMRDEGRLDEYMAVLVDGFNAETLDGLMCRTQISVDYDGALYDCDFNLANRMPLESGPNINDTSLNLNALGKRAIITGTHCFGCTAGDGSSCGGSLT
jgi:radical SAM/Cys-rich protein